MFKRIVSFLFLSALLAISFNPSAQAQTSAPKAANIEFYHATVGTTTAKAIPSVSLKSAVIHWQICNDAVNTSTYLLVGEATDVATDGVSLAPGACVKCDACTMASLDKIKVKGQAAANGYSVVQFRQ